MHNHLEPVEGIAGDKCAAAALESLDDARRAALSTEIAALPSGDALPIAVAPCKMGSAFVRLAAHV